MEAEDGGGGAEGGEGALEEEAHGAQGQEDRLLAEGEQASRENPDPESAFSGIRSIFWNQIYCLELSPEVESAPNSSIFTFFTPFVMKNES